MVISCYPLSSPLRWFSPSSGSVPTSPSAHSPSQESSTHHVHLSWAWTPATSTFTTLRRMLSVWIWTPTLSTCMLCFCTHTRLALYNYTSPNVEQPSAAHALNQEQRIDFHDAALPLIPPNHLCAIVLTGLTKREATTGRTSQRSPAKVSWTRWATCTTSWPLV